MEASTHATTILARDGYPVGAEIVRPGQSHPRVVVINAAMGVSARFYRNFALALAEAGMTVVLWDYRGIGASKPASLKGFQATVSDWIFEDMTAVIDWAHRELQPAQLFLVGHSLGGQVASLLVNSRLVDGMVTLSAQSGYWRLQGAEQKLAVLLHAYVSVPALSHLCGFAPWSRLGLGEDLPKPAALQWAGWLRNREYLLGDDSLPLERYEAFTAPVLAYSFADDKWGTARAVDAMMKAYPNVERRHVTPADFGLSSIGHVGFFRPRSQALWDEVISWLEGL
ncbi:MAG: alpha/beta fold hydrolase [Acidobacteria bacterium]|nr:alpha/beta fold hydrolase [Acidobacteriota bacterium]